MRRFLLIFLMFLLPLQSFAAGVAASKISNMTMGMEQVASTCHDEMGSTQAAQDDCCENVVSCQAMCSVASALIPAVAMPRLPVSTEDKPLGLSISYLSAALAQPVKPPIS